MIIRLLIAVFGFVMGLACLFLTDLVWLLVERVNIMFGRKVKRTERWNARASFAGLMLIGSGLLMLATALRM